MQTANRVGERFFRLRLAAYGVEFGWRLSVDAAFRWERAKLAAGLAVNRTWLHRCPLLNVDFYPITAVFLRPIQGVVGGLDDGVQA